jgi:hypothetical protein
MEMCAQEMSRDDVKAQEMSRDDVKASLIFSDNENHLTLANWELVKYV